MSEEAGDPLLVPMLRAAQGAVETALLSLPLPPLGL